MDKNKNQGIGRYSVAYYDALTNLHESPTADSTDSEVNEIIENFEAAVSSPETKTRDESLDSDLLCDLSAYLTPCKFHNFVVNSDSSANATNSDFYDCSSISITPSTSCSMSIRVNPFLLNSAYGEEKQNISGSNDEQRLQSETGMTPISNSGMRMVIKPLPSRIPKPIKRLKNELLFHFFKSSVSEAQSESKQGKQKQLPTTSGTKKPEAKKYKCRAFVNHKSCTSSSAGEKSSK